MFLAIDSYLKYKIYLNCAGTCDYKKLCKLLEAYTIYLLSLSNRLTIKFLRQLQLEQT